MRWRALVSMLLLPVSVLAAPAHEHGAATLDVAVEGPLLSIAFESPLDNLVGFEQAPKNDRQRALLARMEATLRGGETLLRPSAEAGCRQTAVTVESPYATGAATAAARPAAGDGDGHAEATVRWTFRCARPEALRGIEVQLFAAFAGLRRLQVQLVTPSGQSAATLTAKKRGLAW